MKKYLFLNKKVIAGYSLMAVITYCFLTLMYECYSLITDVIENPDANSPAQITIICIGILLFLLLFLNIMSVIKRHLIFKINTQFRKDIFTKTFQIGNQKYSGKGKEFYTSILLNDIEVLQEDYFATVIEFIGDLFQLLIMLVVISFVGIKYMLLVVLFAIPSIVQPFLLKRKLEKNTETVSLQKEKYTRKCDTLLQEFTIFKTYRKEKVLCKVFDESVEGLEKTKFHEKNWKVINSCLMALCIYILKVGSQLFFTYSAIQGLITVATVTLLLGLANNVGNPVASLLGYIGAINSTRMIREKCVAFLEEPVLKNDGDKVDDYNIKVENLTYQYSDSKIVLKQVNYKFEKGKKYVILGASGCGKSTLFKLLLGYLTADKGSIRIGDKDIKTIGFLELHKTIACISQNPYIFSGTIRDNLTMFQEQFSDDQIWDALKVAGMKETIESTAGKLGEVIEAGGKNFSGGEKQRLTIARAILFNSPILLIDEGMSALDNETADFVERSILNIEDKTIISISHRIQQSLKMYDEIIIMDQGNIVESGSYDFLMKKEGAFCELLGRKEYQNEAV